MKGAAGFLDNVIASRRWRGTNRANGAFRRETVGREVLWILGLLMLALSVRGVGAIGLHEGGWVAGSCDIAFVDEIAPIIATGNPLHFPEFPYPPVPAMIVAALAGFWRWIGGGGELGLHCRVVTLMFSVATVGLVYLIGRLWGRCQALIAATFYAVTMMAVVVQGNVQVYSTFFLLLAFWIALRDDTVLRMWRLGLAGICLGLGVASKYSPLLFAGVLFAPYARHWRRGPDTPSGSTTVGCGNRPSSALWVGSLSVLMVAAFLALWIAFVERDGVYSRLQQLYDQRPHANPFSHYRVFIDRVYAAALTGVGLIGFGATLALVIPFVRRVSPLRWAQHLYRRHRLAVVPCACLVLTVALTLGLPAALNFNDFARYTAFTGRALAAGDSGMFPENRPAVSYIGGFIPESTGLPLFIAGLVGISYTLLRGDRRAMIIAASAIPAYVMLELSRVKINRYALELFPLWCLFAAIWLGNLWQTRRRLWRSLALSATFGIAAYSLVYASAWASFFGPGHNVHDRAGEWLNRTVPRGASLGVRSALLVTGSPELLPDFRFLAGYRLVDYRDNPEYVLLPNGVHAIVAQYIHAVREGYTYSANDWFPSAPSPADLDALAQIVGGDGYLLIREFKKQPTILGFEVGSDSITGRTWLVEHSPASGLRAYRRTGKGG